jgi:phosphocarrier protein HPr
MRRSGAILLTPLSPHLVISLALCAEFLEDGMEVQTFTIRNRLGLHARVAALLVKTANHFASEITLEKDGLEVNGKSIMGILMLAASKGSKITLKAEGKDAAQAIKTLGALIENRFGEE